MYQPIVDLQRGAVAGYETLARFATPDGRPSEATPDRWFAAAYAVGRGAELESISSAEHSRCCRRCRRTAS